MTLLSLIFMQMNGPQHMMDNWGWGDGSWMALMGLFWLAILALLITLIWFLIRHAGASESHHSGESPLDILKKRYARGEIDTEQYRHMKKDITERDY